MITLILMALCISASCAAAAGLIASAQNKADSTDMLIGLTADHPETRA